MPRNLVLAIVFSFLTCGIYSIYWMIKLEWWEVNQLAGEPQATSGGMVFLFSWSPVESMVFTKFIRWGERCDRIRGIQGNSSILPGSLDFRLDIVYFCYCRIWSTKRYLNVKRIHRNSCHIQVFYVSSSSIFIALDMETSTANKFSKVNSLDLYSLSLHGW